MVSNGLRITARSFLKRYLHHVCKCQNQGASAVSHIGQNGRTRVPRFGKGARRKFVDDLYHKGTHFFDSNLCILLGAYADTLSLFFLTFFPQTEAGCRILVNMVLLHVTSNMSDSQTAVGIVPEFRINATKLEQTTTSYGGVIDYLIVNGPPSTISEYPIQLWFDVYSI
jgi:hypothetical protein